MIDAAGGRSGQSNDPVRSETRRDWSRRSSRSLPKRGGELLRHVIICHADIDRRQNFPVSYARVRQADRGELSSSSSSTLWLSRLTALVCCHVSGRCNGEGVKGAAMASDGRRCFGLAHLLRTLAFWPRER